MVIENARTLREVRRLLRTRRELGAACRCQKAAAAQRRFGGSTRQTVTVQDVSTLVAGLPPAVRSLCAKPKPAANSKAAAPKPKAIRFISLTVGKHPRSSSADALVGAASLSLPGLRNAAMRQCGYPPALGRMASQAAASGRAAIRAAILHGPDWRVGVVRQLRQIGRAHV